MADRHCDERGVRQPADAHRDVHAFLQQIDHPVEEHELELQRRVPGEKLVRHRRHVQSPEHHRRSDAQPALRRRPTRGERRLRFVHLGQDAPAALVVFAPLVGECDAPRGAVEEPHVELGFERGEPADHRGQRGVQRFSRSGEAAALDDADEGFHGAQLVHAGGYYSANRSNLLRRRPFILSCA